LIYNRIFFSQKHAAATKKSVAAVLADKTATSVSKSFGQAFSKACAVETAEVCSRSAERETLIRRFSFC
jgi:hypothetical protein